MRALLTFHALIVSSTYRPWFAPSSRRQATKYVCISGLSARILGPANNFVGTFGISPGKLHFPVFGLEISDTMVWKRQYKLPTATATRTHSKVAIKNS